MNDPVRSLEQEIRKCRICLEQPAGKPLPHEPNPVAVLSAKARIRIIGQAPGTRVHASGKPFTDPSGDRLREWMGVDETVFYDAQKIAITPMGFCFPGLDRKGGDLPPRKECAAAWQDRVTRAMPQTELVLLIGMYAQKSYLGKRFAGTLTATVQDWSEIASRPGVPQCVPLPHPSWRNNAWIRKNPFFTRDLLPFLQRRVREVLRADRQ